MQYQMTHGWQTYPTPAGGGFLCTLPLLRLTSDEADGHFTVLQPSIRINLTLVEPIIIDPISCGRNIGWSSIEL